MSCTVSETVQTVNFPTLEVGEIDPTGPAYPFPKLILSGGTTTEEIPTVVLQNDLLEVHLAPTLGGRILYLGSSPGSLPPAISLLSGGRRGVMSPTGVQLSLDGSERLDSLGIVDTVFNVSEEGEWAEVTIASIANWPLSFHLKFGIEENSAELAVEAKIFNRSLRPVPYNSGLLGSDEFAGLFSEDLSPVRGSYLRFQKPRWLSPHQLDTWKAQLIPREPNGENQIFGNGVSIYLCDDKIQVVASREVGPLKVVLNTASMETFEAGCETSPRSSVNLPLDSQHLPLRGVVVLNKDREELLRWPTEEASADNAAEVPQEEPAVPQLSDSPQQLRHASFEMKHRALAHYLLGMKALGNLRWEAADFEFEQSLLFNAENHLAWWLKAYSSRMADPETPGSQELPNAHYLAPLEPALRMEGFLSQPIQPGFEANALLAPLADQPEAFVDVACQLIELGLLEDASRLLTEALRLIEVPMLRYLLAYCYLAGTRMMLEADEQVRRAGSLPLVAPFPVRPTEARALKVLASKWPQDERLGQYASLSQLHVADNQKSQ